MLLVTFDGLRRDMVNQETMPNLSRFLAEGSDFVNSRSIFPSETRVAISSLVTGCPPGAHGIVANQFMHPEVNDDRIFNTARQEDLIAAGRVGQLLARPSLGARLAAAGRTLAVVSTATPGATWMMHSDATRLGGFVFSADGPARSVTAEAAALVIDRLGPIPDAGVPESARIDYATRVMIEHVWPRLRPDVAILWYCDPDKTAHRFGLLAAETAEAQRRTDAAFGRLLAWWREGGEDRPQNIIVMSDHGQITGREEVSLSARDHAGLAGKLVPGYVSSLYLDDPSVDNLKAAAAALMVEPWCGIVFTNGGDGVQGLAPGSFDLAAVHGNHQRAGHLVFTLAATPPDGRDRLGSCLFSGGIKPGGGIHGGLQCGELATVLGGSGPAFKRGVRSELRCWLPDIAPTILRILDIPTEGMVGRPLTEGLAADNTPPPSLELRRITASAGNHSQLLEQWVRDGVAITENGWSAKGMLQA